MDSGVLLIGGAPGAGKTSLARAVAAELGFGSLTGDDLAVAGRALTTEETHPPLHPSKGIGHTRYFTETPAAQLIEDAVALEETLWPVFVRVIRSHLAAEAPTTIDWWLLSPVSVSELAEAAVTSIWLYVEPDLLEARERRNVEFWAESFNPERMFSQFMARSLWRNELGAAQAHELGMPVLSQSSDDTIEDLAATVVELISDSHR